MYSSQWQQDKILNELIFKDKTNGFFIDIGAHDGKEISNSIFFESQLGWKGICIEPIKEVYNNLIKNRKCTCINACAYNIDGTIEFNKVSGYSEMLSGISSEYDNRHVQRIRSEVAQKGGNVEVIESDCFRVSTILQELYGTQSMDIDYLSIDTEGSELKVLQGIDLKQTSISVIEIEINYPDKEKEITDYLKRFGFHHLMKIGGDAIYVCEEIYDRVQNQVQLHQHPQHPRVDYKNLFIITSYLNLDSKMSKFSPSERLSQTIETVKSVLSHNGIPILVELSKLTQEQQDKLMNAGVNVLINLSENQQVVQLANVNKSIGDIASTLSALSFIKQNLGNTSYKKIYKISGRYRLNVKYSDEKFGARPTFRLLSNESGDQSRQDKWYSTALYSFSDLTEMTNVCTGVLNGLLQSKYIDIEHGFYHETRDPLVIEDAGVCGEISKTGEYFEH